MRVDRARIGLLVWPLAALGALAATGAASAQTKRGDEAYPPHRAGLRITLAGNFCTSGFGVADQATGANFALTAGHCGANGTVKIAGHRVGELMGSRFLCCDVTNSDTALYTVPANESSATISGATRSGLFGAGGLAILLARTSVSVTGYFDDSAFYKGQRVCTSGSFGGFVCGHVTDADYRYRFRGGRRLRDLVCFDVPVAGGDSGAPVFALRGGKAIAAGLVSIGDQLETCFTTIENALRSWDVGLLVADGEGVRIAGPDEAITDDDVGGGAPSLRDRLIELRP